MSRSGMNFIKLFALLLLLPGANGLDFSMGISNGMNGASECQRMNVGVDSSFVSTTVASPEHYSTAAIAAGSGALNFDETFNSSDNGEHVRLIAKMSNSTSYTHGFAIEEQTGARIRASESLTVDRGRDIEASAQAWNSLGFSAKAGLKIPIGSLTNYSNYGDAMDASVTAYQTAIVPKGTKFNVFAEAKKGFSTQRSSSTMISSRAMNAQTNSTVNQTTSRMKNILKPA